MKVGQIVFLKRLGRYVRAIVISVDTEFVDLKIDYARDKGLVVRLKKDSKDIIKLDFTSKEVYKGNLEAFEYKNDIFRV